uniref:Uncharacterized protein n=1 Tax=Anguilla anguilla TaxID=7936 RepID=A0A0E9PXZ3_ANGAN
MSRQGVIVSLSKAPAPGCTSQNILQYRG